MPALRRPFTGHIKRMALRLRRPSPAAQKSRRATAAQHVVNDIHSQLNRTRVSEVVTPRSHGDVQAVVRSAQASGQPIALAGGRHAMGGQQFAADSVLVDMTGMNRVMRFEPERGLIEVEAGMLWPQLVDYTVSAQRGRASQVGIVQKQTGADRLSIGGALAANIHGRGLRFKPIIGDVESFTLVDARGDVLTCSRRENAELFRLAIGGYGLFGIITSAKLRLAPRRPLERVVRLARLDELHALFAERIRDGFLYGDFQFAIAPDDEKFLNEGIFSCYRPAAPGQSVPAGQRELSEEDWMELLHLAHTDRRRAFDLYARHYLATDGQLYWSDTHQLSVYLDDYHRALDARLGEKVHGSEMITELYVPRESLALFMRAVREDFRRHETELIYGTVRLIEKDDESFLAWAREPFACIVFNLHVRHDAQGVAKAREDFRRLIDRAIEFGGSYYLTYHRWATREQLLGCYPQMPEFLRLKRRHDPREIFQSDWYRHHRAMLAGLA